MLMSESDGRNLSKSFEKDVRDVGGLEVVQDFA